MMIQTPLLQELQNMLLSFLRIEKSSQALSCGSNSTFSDQANHGISPFTTSYAFVCAGVKSCWPPKGVII